MKNKLKSQRGASLILALLLFLVCAVIGSIVLIAGTASAGRLSELTEADQRYYSVSSAAQVLAGAFTESEVVFIREYQYLDVTPVTTAGSMTTVGATEHRPVTPPQSGEAPVFYTTSIERPNPSALGEPVKTEITKLTEGLNVVEYLSCRLMLGDNELNSEEAWKQEYFPAPISNQGLGSMTMSVPAGSSTITVTASPRLNADGSLTLTLYSDTSGGLTMEMTLLAAGTTKTTRIEEETESKPTANGYEIITPVEIVKRTTITWSVVNLKVNSLKGASGS